jgi:hypothetical protein
MNKEFLKWLKKQNYAWAMRGGFQGAARYNWGEINTQNSNRIYTKHTHWRVVE